jgi:hypothetical protein
MRDSGGQGVREWGETIGKRSGGQLKDCYASAAVAGKWTGVDGSGRSGLSGRSGAVTQRRV